MAQDGQENQNIQADSNSIAFGSISVGGSVGDIHIGHTIGFTSDQVSTLITQISTTFRPKPFDGSCPYKGLEVFEEQDSELFFGREILVEDLVKRVRKSRTLFVTGPSGSGKSSLVRAGLIPVLKHGAVKELYSDRWLFASMKPGRDPIEALAGVFSRLKGPDIGEYLRKNAASADVLQKCAESVLEERRDQRLVLFIDQFEETFTQLHPDKAESFIQMLDCAATIENGRVIILFAMRSDFVPNCAASPQLNALLNKQFVQIGAMQPNELVSAIAQPALRVGLRIDPDLIAQIINDMEGEPGALPLMQFALKDLFESQQGREGVIALTLGDYLARGGIHKALERHADQTFAGLGAEEQELARSIFTGLIEVGRGTVDTRRTAIFDELVPVTGNIPEVQTIVRKLADARLITTDDVEGRHTVTISHEKLIDAWPWLKKLVNENREVIALQNDIVSDAQEWLEHNRDTSYLYSGARLVSANEQLKSNKLVLSGTALEYIQAGQARKRRSQIIWIGSIAAIFVVLVAVSIFTNNLRLQAVAQKKQADAARVAAQDAEKAAQAASVLAAANEEKAQKEAEISRAGELAALALSGRDTTFNQSILLGLEAHKAVNIPRTRGALLTLAASHPGLEAYLSGHNNWVNSIAFSPDGTRLASGGGFNDHPLLLWDVSNPIAPTRLAALDGSFSWVTSVAFSPDGTHLASAVDDKTILLWDVSDPTAPSLLSTLPGSGDSVSSIAFNLAGTQLAAGSSDASIALWDVSDPANPSQLATLTGHEKRINSLAYSPDGTQLASGSKDNTVILWNVSDPANPSQLALLAEHDDPVKCVAFSPGGTQLASGSEDRDIILWDVTNPDAPAPLSRLQGHKDWVNALVFNPDGTRIFSASEDATLIEWDVSDPADPEILKTLPGHSSGVVSVAFNPDGTQLASGSKDETIILWAVNKAVVPAQLSRLDSPTWVDSVAYSPDGKHLASTSDDTVLLWDVSDPAAPSESSALSGHSDAVTFIAYSPDGTQLASGSRDNTIILWEVSDPARPSRLATLSGHKDWVNSVAFSPDGKRLASGSDDATILLWDISNPKAPATLSTLDGNEDWVNTVAFSPDGNYLATGGEDRIVTLWDVSDPAKPSELTTLTNTRNSVRSIAFSPDGKWLAAGTSENFIYIWEMRDPAAPIHRSTLKGHINWVNSLSFSPDGTQLASGSWDSNTIVWDLSKPATPSELARLTGQTESVNSVAFSPDGRRLASGSGDKTIALWDIDLDSWISKSCQRVGRNFTRAEWNQYFPGQTYRKTCEQWGLEGEPADTGAEVPAVPAITPTALPAATATPEAIPQNTYLEEFNGNLDSWTRFMVSGVERQVDPVLVNGRLQVKLSPYQDKLPRVYWVNNAVTYSDVQIDIVTTNNGNNANGVSLICQFSDRGWYEFTMSNDGLYAIYAFDTNLYQEEQYILLANGGAPAIKTGQVTNTYTVVCRGNELSLYANGALVNTVTDTQLNFMEGVIGFGVSSPRKLPIDLQLEALSVSIPE